MSQPKKQHELVIKVKFDKAVDKVAATQLVKNWLKGSSGLPKTCREELPTHMIIKNVRRKSWN